MSAVFHGESTITPVTAPRIDEHPAQMRTEGGLVAYLLKVWAIARKDLQVELRSKDIFGIMGAFSILAAIIFAMAFDLRVPQSSMVAPGVLWVAVLFGGVLGLNRTFGVEVDRGSLAALLLSPVDRSAIYFGKTIANLLFTLVTELLLLPVILVLFDINLFHWLILLSLLLGTIGYVGVGVLFAALAASARTRESLLPVLLLPVMAPVFMAGMKVTSIVVDGRGLWDVQRWIGMLVAYDVIFLAVAFLVFDFVWEEI